MEESKEVIVIKVHYKCEKCDEGYMFPFGSNVYMTSPPKYPHICDKCGYQQDFNKIYPSIEYK